MNIILLPLEPFSLTIYFLIIIVLVMVLTLLFRGDTPEKTYQKIIGGTIVFVVALISKNPYVIFSSLFIGGLIIASEKFLQSLAAILRTSATEMPKTIEALNNTNVVSATSDEINAQKNSEQKTESSMIGIGPHLKERLNLNQISSLEKKIIDLVKKKYGDNFTEDLKLENKYGKIVVDGVLHMKSDSQNLNLDNILAIIETRFVSNLNSNFTFEFSVKRVLEKIRYLYINKQVLILFFAQKLTVERAEEIETRLQSLYVTDKTDREVVFGFLNVTEDLEVELIKLPDTRPHVI